MRDTASSPVVPVFAYDVIQARAVSRPIVGWRIVLRSRKSYFNKANYARQRLHAARQKMLRFTLLRQWLDAGLMYHIAASNTTRCRVSLSLNTTLARKVLVRKRSSGTIRQQVRLAHAATHRHRHASLTRRSIAQFAPLHSY